MRARTVLPTIALGLLLAACGSSNGGSSTSGQPAAGGAGSSASGAASGGVTALKTESSSLGKIVTDASGRALYKYDKDTQGATSSACTGACMSIWPPADEGSSMPMVSGVTAKLATIKGPDGKTQLTLAGWPLYYFSGDTGPGTVAGQNYQGIWHVVTAAGTPVTTAPSTGSGSSGAGGGYGSGY